jgi:hypothetical protein
MEITQQQDQDLKSLAAVSNPQTFFASKMLMFVCSRAGPFFPTLARAELIKVDGETVFKRFDAAI